MARTRCCPGPVPASNREHRPSCERAGQGCGQGQEGAEGDEFGAQTVDAQHGGAVDVVGHQQGEECQRGQKPPACCQEAVLEEVEGQAGVGTAQQPGASVGRGLGDGGKGQYECQNRLGQEQAHADLGADGGGQGKARCQNPRLIDAIAPPVCDLAEELGGILPRADRVPPAQGIVLDGAGAVGDGLRQEQGSQWWANVVISLVAEELDTGCRE